MGVPGRGGTSPQLWPWEVLALPVPPLPRGDWLSTPALGHPAFGRDASTARDPRSISRVPGVGRGQWGQMGTPMLGFWGQDVGWRTPCPGIKTWGRAGPPRAHHHPPSTHRWLNPISPCVPLCPLCHPSATHPSALVARLAPGPRLALKHREERACQGGAEGAGARGGPTQQRTCAPSWPRLPGGPWGPWWDKENLSALWGVRASPPLSEMLAAPPPS